MSSAAILISGMGGDIGCSVARAVRDLGFRIIGCDMNRAAILDGLVDHSCEIAPAREQDAYFARLSEIIAAENVRYFIPVPEAEISVLHENRSAWKDLPAKVLLNNAFILDRFLDKWRTAEFLRELGINVPRTYLLSDYDGSLPYPLVVKGRRTCGGKRNWVVDTDRELQYLRDIGDEDLIAQEYLGTDDEEYTTGVFSDGEKISTITFRRKLGFGGLSVEAQLAETPLLTELSEKVARAVNLTGSINVQSRKCGEEYLPFEINPRLSSTLLFRKKFGFDDAAWWIHVLDGQSYEYKKLYKRGRAIRFLQESYLDLEPA